MKYIDNSRSKTFLIGIYIVLGALMLLDLVPQLIGIGAMLGIPIGIWLGYRAREDGEGL